MMTASELEHFAGLVPGPGEVADTVIALIADWRAMYYAITDHWVRADCSKSFDKCPLAIAYSNLKVKP